MKVLAIIQARMGSTRLPGKIMKFIANKPMLGYTIDRVMRSIAVDQVVVATSTGEENDPVEDYCDSSGVECFRLDNEDDVLERFYRCAKKFKGDIIVRITGDCPLIDPSVIDRVVRFFIDNREYYDIVINTWFPGSYPSGFDAEVFSFESLEKQNNLEKDIKRREHVMNTLTNNNFRVCKLGHDLDKGFLNGFSCNLDYVHLSVDTKEDFDLIEKIIVWFGDDKFNFYDVMYLLNKYPELANINMDKERRENIRKIKNS